MSFKLVTSFALAFAGICIRLALALLKWGPILAARVEVSTPLNSIERVAEGLFLKSLGESPYAGSSLHAPPLLLLLLEPFSDISAPRSAVLFVLVDVFNAVLLFLLASEFLRRTLSGSQTATPAGVSQDQSGSSISPAGVSQDQSGSSGSPADVSQDQSDQAGLPAGNPVHRLACWCAAIYICNPFTIMACVACSWASLEYFAILIALYGGLVGRPVMCSLGLAGAAYLTIGPILLTLPVAQLLMVGGDWPVGSAPLKHAAGSWLLAAQMIVLLIVTLALLVGMSTASLEGTRGLLAEHSSLVQSSLEWMTSTYGFILTVEDLRPNLGLYWYFFIELFDFFRPMFLVALLSQPLVMVFPLLLRLHHRPMFCSCIMIMGLSIFKPYPSVSDLGFYLSLLPMFTQQLKHMRYAFVTVNGFLAAAVFSPIFWHMWIQTGVANSNFYYSITLIYGASQMLLLVDCLAATIHFDRQLKVKSLQMN